MEFTANQSDLHRALSIVSRAISSRPLQPILSNVLLHQDGDTLYLTATNLELGITTYIPVEGMAEGSTTLPARLLSDFVNRLPTGELVKVTHDTERESVRLSCGKVRTVIKGIAADDFPGIPATDEQIVTLDGTLLRDTINLVAIAAAKDNTRPVFGGVLLRVQDHTLSLAATNGYRIAFLDAPVEIDGTLDALVPALALTELKRLLTDTDIDKRTVAIGMTANQIVFTLGETVLLSRLLEGPFPDYRRMIPIDSPTVVTCSRVVLADAVRLAQLFAPEDSNFLYLTLAEGTLGLATATAECGEHVGEIDATLVGPPLQIGVDIRYLADGLGALACSEVSLSCTTPLAPLVLRDTENNGYVYLMGSMAKKSQLA